MKHNGDKNVPGKNSHSQPDTLERLLIHCASTYPQRAALADPPNRARLERRPEAVSPLAYDYQQLDDAVTRIAARFNMLGLRPGDPVLLQLPNFSETPILVLALMRARLIPCLVPLSWSMDDISASFEHLKPKALISCGQLEERNYSQDMRDLAFAHLHVRFVFAVGYNIVEEVSDITPLFVPPFNHSEDEPVSNETPQALNDVALVTYIDPTMPVPHSNGQILASGLLHVLELGLTGIDHILSAYPLSSIPGLAAHMVPWLLSGCSLTLHQPFAFDILQEQLQTENISYFAAPEQVIEWLLRHDFPAPQKLVIVRRDRHLPLNDLPRASATQLFDLWNLGGLGSIPAKIDPQNPVGLFPHGRICLPSTPGRELCLAAAKILNGRLYIKGRIFPNSTMIGASKQWLSLGRRLDENWLDTGMEAFAGPDNSILLGGELPGEIKKVAS